MTCASCVNRIERYLRKAEGVDEASVNLARERATVTFDPARVDVPGLGRAVEAAGYDDQVTAIANKGRTPVIAAIDGRIAAVIGIADTLKASSPAAVAALRGLGLRVVMLTGDNEARAQAIAREAGVDEVLADVRPDEKAAQIRRLQKRGLLVAMVGDGVNDAPALAQADVGVAVGTGTDIAIEAAGITLMSGDLRSLVTAISLSRATMRNIRQNLFWAFAYNVALVPLAAGLLLPFTGWLLNPIYAAAAMAPSSVSVVSDALRLRCFRARAFADGGTSALRPVPVPAVR